MNWKAKIKHLIPSSLLNNFLLRFPFLYRTKVANYETNLEEEGGIDELLTQLSKVLDLAGNIIECGSSRCGTSIIMTNYLHLKHINSKLIYACDSFEGFDPIELEREKKEGLTKAPYNAFTSTSYEYVKKKIKKLRLDDTIIPVKGFFNNTLRQIESNYCFALIDCDLKESTIYCAETIWPNLVSKGRVVFDDYNSQEFRGVRKGIKYFINKHKDEVLEYGLMKRLYYICKK